MNGELTVAKENSPLVRRTGQQISRGFRRYAIFLILAALILFFNALEPAFLRANNLLGVYCRSPSSSCLALASPLPWL
jgi:ABC-type xylose transport system permease subunit